MEKFVSGLRELIDFKETTEIGDVVLIAGKEPHMLVYAVVRSIERDSTRKDEWWHLGLDILAVPIQSVTWTLREPQFTGRETFTMGGKGRFIQAVRLSPVPLDKSPEAQTPPQDAKGGKGGLRLVK